MKPIILLKIFIANICCNFFPGGSTLTRIELVVKLLDLTLQKYTKKFTYGLFNEIVYLDQICPQSMEHAPIPTYLQWAEI